MRSHESDNPPAPPNLGVIFRKSAGARGLKTGFINDARRAATPYIVDCFSLNGEDLPYEIYATQLRERDSWCVERYPNDHEIEPLRDHGRLIGRRYRFAHERDAAAFRVYFG